MKNMMTMIILSILPFYDETMDKCRAIDMDTFKAVDLENDYVVNPIEIEINVYGVDRDE